MTNNSDNINEIVIYQADNLTRVEVKIGNDTVWLNRNQIASLFNRDVKTIGKHINNVFSEAELDREATVAKFATVQIEGDREVERQIEHYNLDVIISVGYRVKSKQGTQFRIWANKILKDYLLKGYAVNKRIDRIEDNVHTLIERVDEIDFQIKSSLPPSQGIFYDGQVFDAYVFVSDLIRTARKSIILIDNYIDDSVFQLFTKRNKNVSATIYTKNISKSLKQDLEKHNAQYPKIEMEVFTKAHDRFLMIDEKELYNIGASLKDLGKKWFAFSRMDSLCKEALPVSADLANTVIAFANDAGGELYIGIQNNPERLLGFRNFPMMRFVVHYFLLETVKIFKKLIISLLQRSKFKINFIVQ